VRISLRVSPLASACLLSECAGHPPPVPLAGSLRDIAALTGEWTGDYPTTLTVSFVRVQGNEVSGTLAPYRDPECGCALLTRFVGWLRGDTISGTNFSSHERSEAEAHGRWQVVRKSRSPG
jgi:hypothetical protein